MGGVYQLRYEVGSMRALVWSCLVVVAGCAKPTAPVDDAGVVVAKVAPPIAPKKPHVRELHGETFTDDYFWLREKGTKEVEDYLKAEAEFTRTQFKQPAAALIESIFKEMVSHLAEDDSTPPVKDGAYEYWRESKAGQEHPVYLRRALPGGAREVLLDVNALAAGKDFLHVAVREIAPNDQLLLFSTDETGARDYVLQVKDLKSGQLLPERLARADSAAWAADSKSFVYTVTDDARRAFKVLRHVLGTDPAKDAVVYEEKDERFDVEVTRSASRRWLVLTAASALTSEVRVLDAKKPQGAPRLIAARREGHEYEVDDDGARFVIRTNDRGRNFRLVTAPYDQPGEASWKELVAHDEAVMIDGFAVFKGQVALQVRRDGLAEVDVLDTKTLARTTLPVPDAVHTVWLDQNEELDAPSVLYGYVSFAAPIVWARWDFGKRTSTVVKEQQVPGGFDRTKYESQRVWATANDGVKVPVSLVFKKGVPLDGSAPLWLEGYGAYGSPFDVAFSPTFLSLLDRGVIIATAHVRGGGDLGKKWHEDGRLAKKMNTFTDFIACAEFLVAEKWTNPKRLLINGASAGGLLMGAVTNLRPDLFKAVIAEVPFVDVINTMSDASLPLTAGEFEEWGNPAKPEEYAWLRAYSPYDNLSAKAYPAMLVRSSYNDTQVMYFEPAKYVARLRAMKTDENPLFFDIEMSAAGHGGKSGRYEGYREVAGLYAFALWQLGVEKLR